MTTSVKLTVTGMKCGGCEATIKKELDGKAGIGKKVSGLVFC